MRVARFAVAALLQFMAASPQNTDFRYRREVVLPAVAPGTQSCAILDGLLYAGAAPALADVRLLGTQDGFAQEIPYALTLSETGSASDPATVLNLRKRGQTVTFDLEMPNRPYSGLVLQLGGKNFRATAKVTGVKNPGDENGTILGTSTLFDLSGQRLGRNTALALPESSFAFLHVELAFAPAPGQARFEASPTLVEGAQVPPSREAQALFTPVAEAAAVVERGRASVARFVLPAHVPVERVSFVLTPGYTTNFSRPVRILAQAEHANGSQEPANEELDGEITRVRIAQAGQSLRASSLSIPALVASNLQSAARVEVEIENGDEPPLAIRSVRLEMRQRKLCFRAPGVRVALYFGADGLKPPAYDLSHVFQPGQAAALARLGPQLANPAYLAPAKAKPFPERHPRLLYGTFAGLLAVLGSVTWRMRRIDKPT